MFSNATLIAELRAQRAKSAKLLATETCPEYRSLLERSLQTADALIALVQQAPPFLMPDDPERTAQAAREMGLP